MLSHKTHMKRILCILMILFTASALANDPHKLAEDGKWIETLELIKQQSTGLKTVKNGKTLMDLAVDLAAPSDVVVLFLDLGVTTAPEAAMDVADAEMLTEDQLRLIEKWLAGDYAKVTPYECGESCMDVVELLKADESEKVLRSLPRASLWDVKRVLDFDSPN